MGLFDRFRRKKAPEIQHPVYGRIGYVDDNTWEGGRVRFAPFNKEVEVLITAGPEGPNDGHARFLAELEARWPELVKAWDPLLRTALEGWIDHPEGGDVMARLTVESISLFAGMEPDQDWDFQFWCEEASHWPTIVMKGWTPQQCFIDG